MIDGLSVNVRLLHDAARIWDSAADDLGAGRRQASGAAASATTFGDQAGPAAMAFLESVAEEVAWHGGAAQSHANALAYCAVTYVRLDEDAANEMRAILPWASQALQSIGQPIIAPTDALSHGGPSPAPPVLEPPIGPKQLLSPPGDAAP